MHRSEIDSLKGIFPGRSSQFAASEILFSDWLIDEPISEELDIFDPSDLKSLDEMGDL